MTVKVGDRVDYVSPFFTGTYDAVVTQVRDAGFVDIEVNIPGTREPWPIRAVRFGEGHSVRPKC